MCTCRATTFGRHTRCTTCCDGVVTGRPHQAAALHLRDARQRIDHLRGRCPSRAAATSAGPARTRPDSPSNLDRRTSVRQVVTGRITVRHCCCIAVSHTGRCTQKRSSRIDVSHTGRCTTVPLFALGTFRRRCGPRCSCNRASRFHTPAAARCTALRASMFPARAAAPCTAARASRSPTRELAA